MASNDSWSKRFIWASSAFAKFWLFVLQNLRISLRSQHLARFQILYDDLIVMRVMFALNYHFIACLTCEQLICWTFHFIIRVYLCQNLLFSRDYDTSFYNVAHCGALLAFRQPVSPISPTRCFSRLSVSFKKHFAVNKFILFFRVPDLSDICIERCENAMLDCILDCNNDSACLSECIRSETDCITRK